MKEAPVLGINITAIGGGGFTQGTHRELDVFCLAQVDRQHPKVGFIGTASNDDPLKIERFHTRFDGYTASHIHLPQSLDAQSLADQLSGLDMVYVGGGDTEAMVNHWRKNKWDNVLCDAARAGLALAGVSAGAVCWFDHFLFNSGDGPMRPVQGLGLIKGGACPHYSTEIDRREALRKSVANATMPDSIAIDDGAAVAFRASGPVAICSAELSATAYHIRRSSDGHAYQSPIVL
jgi:peptidase E